jgi:hypothetical protein
MNAKQTALLLFALLLCAIGYIVYKEATNPLKGYKLVYDRQNYKLFVKDTLHSDMKSSSFAGGGRRVPYAEGHRRIMDFRRRLPGKDDTTTRYIAFSFDSVFNYMGYVLTNFKRDEKDTLGMTLYIADSDIPLRQSNGRQVYQRTVLLRPTINKKQSTEKENENFDFFNQGSICPVNCPTGGDVNPPPPSPIKKP